MSTAASSPITGFSSTNAPYIADAGDTADITIALKSLYYGTGATASNTTGIYGMLYWLQNAPTFAGTITVNGDVSIGGGDLVSSTTTFNLINTTATTLNVGGAATTLNIGGAAGATTTTIAGGTNSGTSTTKTIQIGSQTIGSGATQLINVGNVTINYGTSTINIGGVGGSIINLLGRITTPYATVNTNQTLFNTAGTIASAAMLSKNIYATPSTATTLTLDTGTNLETNFGYFATIPVGTTTEWILINEGSATVTVSGSSGHTLRGTATVTIQTAAKFITRKSATNTFVTYRV
jgi:hypothetical protein